MIKKSVLFIASLALVFSCASFVSAGEGPESIVIKGPAGKKEVTFKHHEHQGRSKCGDCHHTKGEDGKQSPYVEKMEIKKCTECHELKNSKDNIHVNCLGCHKEEKKKGNANAPVSCSKAPACHASEAKKAEGC